MIMISKHYFRCFACMSRHLKIAKMSGYELADGGMGIVEMLFCTSLVALVGAGEQPAFSPRRLQIINTKVRSTCRLDGKAPEASNMT